MARALLLDAEGTLIELAEPASLVYARIAHEHGIPADEVELARGLPAAIRTREVPDYETVPRARIPELEREGWRALVRGVLGAAAADGPLFDALFAYYGRGSAWRAAPGAEAALAAARDAGWRIALVSNMDARLGGILAALGLASLLDAALYPAVCGLAKPDPRIFRAALEAVGADAASSVYVGDRERDCLEAARRAGLRTLRYAADTGGTGALGAWSELPEALEKLAAQLPSPREDR